MKQKQKCGECGKDYWTSMVKVFVFKQHTCSNDKNVLIISETSEGRIYICPQCRKIFHKNNAIEYNNMGTKIEGSTRDFLEKDKRLSEDLTLEAEKILVPQEGMCQGCRNRQNRVEQATKKRERKLAMGLPDDMRVIPDTVTNPDLFKFEIFRKTQEEYQEARKAEAYERQKAERAAAEAERQKKLAEIEKSPEEILPSKEQLQPLIDLETAKLIEEVKKKDEHIAELKRKLDEAKKLEEEKKKKETEIGKLKEKLEGEEKKT
jgi:DNA-directed RNA polymerase subunit M/transcription elongation factor TFIIS